MATIYPLWQDIYWHSADDTLSVRYSILTGGVELYRGVAYAPPDDSMVEVRLNDIFADYMGDVSAPILNSVGASPPKRKDFVFRDLDNNADYEYDVVADYSREEFNPIASDPIVPVYDSRQTKIYTLWGGSAVTVIKEFRSGSKSTDTVTACRTYSTTENLARLTLKDAEREVVWDVQDTCAKYAIYYLNARGGWDSLVLGGRCSYSEKYTRSGLKREYSNYSRTAYSKVNYINEIVRTYTLRTSLLTDEQAAKMYHLLGTNMAVLYDLETQTPIPVTITNSSYEVKTYKGNGCKMTQYEITAEYAQDIIRR